MSDPASDLIPAFQAIVGRGQVVRPGDAPGDGRFVVGGRAPRCVVRPGSVEEVSGCLAEAHRLGLAVAPAGHGVRLHWGSAPARLDLVVSLARMDRVLAWEPADLTMSVQAGLTLAALNAHIGDQGQFLPIDPPWPERSTVGGLVATATAGPYRARYGTLRDLLMGVTVVQGDGTVVRAGGRVVKNVTGYDVTKLHVGALGTLGVLVECHLRLHPRPSEEASWLIPFPGLETALAAATALRDTPVELSRLQLLDRGALTALGQSGGGALAVTIGSVAAAVEAQGARVEEVTRTAGGQPVRMARADAFWAEVARIAWAAPPEPALALRVGVRPTDLGKALAAVEATLPAGPTRRASAEVPNGALHVRVDGLAPADVAGVVARARAAITALDGSLVVEHAPAGAAGVEVWGDVGPALGPMRRLKAELDPAGILNPGRFVGGI